jgi:hypothetical protein
LTSVVSWLPSATALEQLPSSRNQAAYFSFDGEARHHRAARPPARLRVRQRPTPGTGFEKRRQPEIRPRSHRRSRLRTLALEHLLRHELLELKVTTVVSNRTLSGTKPTISLRSPALPLLRAHLQNQRVVQRRFLGIDEIHRTWA